MATLKRSGLTMRIIDQWEAERSQYDLLQLTEEDAHILEHLAYCACMGNNHEKASALFNRLSHEYLEREHINFLQGVNHG